MAEEDKQLKLKFRISDGTDICDGMYSSSTTIEALKEVLFCTWPRDKSVVPKIASEMKLIYAGKILDDGKTLGGSIVNVTVPSSDYITMHVVVQPAVVKKHTGKNQSEKEKQGSCSCSIL